MLSGKKGFTAKQSKRTSKRMEQATIGTHMPRKQGARGSHMNGDSVSFSSARQTRRAAHGQVGAIKPQSAADYSGQVGSSNRYVQERLRRRRARRVLGVVAVIAVIAAIAIVAGVSTYHSTVGSALALRDSDAKSALSAETAGQPYYVLIDAELGQVADSLDNGGPDELILARIDESQKKIALVAVPSTLGITLGDNQTHPLSDAAASGDAALVSSIDKAMGVSISHIVKVTASDLEKLVDSVGGVTVDVSEEVDDPDAGSVYLPAGTQTLDGKAALTYLRATNLSAGVKTQMRNQLQFTAALLSDLLSTQSMSFSKRLSSLDSYVQTDLSSNDAVDAGNALANISADDIVCAITPGYVKEANGVTSSTSYYVASSSDIAAVMASIEAGEAPQDADNVDTSSVDPAQVTVTVQNGSGITGAASSMASYLGSAGFQVKSSGNADQQVYTDTLVIYNGDGEKLNAQAVVNTLGFGRTVASNGYYSYATDVLVIIGTDCKPVA